MEFETLIAKRAVERATAKDYARWAEKLLSDGTDSINIAILAGMDLEKSSDTEEIESYFKACAEELGIELPSEEDGLLYFALYQCNQIIDENLSPRKGLSVLDTLYCESDYDPMFGIWSELSEDVWMVEDGEPSFFNSGITQSNIDQFITKVAHQFIKLNTLELPDSFLSLSACSHCGFIGEITMQRDEKTWLPESIFRIIYGYLPASKPICKQCGLPYPKGMSDYMGRELYINSVSE